MIKTKLSALIILIVLIVARLVSFQVTILEDSQALAETKYLSSNSNSALTDEKNVLLWPANNGLPGDATKWRSYYKGTTIGEEPNGKVVRTADNYGMKIINVTNDSEIIAPGDGEIVSLDSLKTSKAEAMLEDVKEFNDQDTVVIKLSKLSDETLKTLEYRFKDESVHIYNTIVPYNNQNLYLLINNINKTVSNTTITRGEKIGLPKKVSKDADHENGTDYIYLKMFKENGELVEDLEKYLSALYTKIDEENYENLKKKNEKGSVIDAPLLSLDGDYIVKTDMPGACPVVTDRDTIIKGLTYWLKKQDRINNAIKILDSMLKYQEQYKVNLVYVYAIFKHEQGMGTIPCPPSAIPQSFNNWGSVKARYGLPNKDRRTWKQFPSLDEMVRYEMWLFAEGKHYFKKQRYSVKTIAPTYCSEHWGQRVIEHMQTIYKGMEIDAPLTVGDGSTPFVGTQPKSSDFLLKKSGDGFSDVTKVDYQGGYLYYRNYKQYKGSYKNNPYSQGTIHSSGCGPTSIAIILSGYGIEATPGDTAKAMGGAHNGGTNGYKLKACIKKYGLEAKYVSFSGVSVTKIKQIMTAQLKTGRPISLSVHNNSLNLTQGGHLIAVLAVSDDESKFLISNPSGTGGKTGWLDANKLADAATGKYCVLVQTDPKPTSEILD